MDPVIVAGGLAVVFALVALLLWRRTAELEEQVRTLEARLADKAAPPTAQAEAKTEAPRASAEDEEDEEDEDERAEADDTEDEGDDEEPEEPSAEDDADQGADAAAPAEAEAAPEPAEAATPEPAPNAAGPDPLRLEALKIVSEAFELARYLDFDAIVEKPSTYRVTIPITAANGEAVRYLEDGMFTCLSQVRIEDDNAVLHIDTGKGPP